MRSFLILVTIALVAVPAQAQVVKLSTSENLAAMQTGSYRVLAVIASPVASQSTILAAARAKAQEAAAAPEVPLTFALEANYPNPFNPQTVIQYALPQSVHVRLHVYDVLGRSVAVLVDEQLEAGRYSAAFDARSLASGIYVYRIEAGSFVESRSMMLVK